MEVVWLKFYLHIRLRALLMFLSQNFSSNQKKRYEIMEYFSEDWFLEIFGYQKHPQLWIILYEPEMFSSFLLNCFCHFHEITGVMGTGISLEMNRVVLINRTHYYTCGPNTVCLNLYVHTIPNRLYAYLTFRLAHELSSREKLLGRGCTSLTRWF